jgi:hypothetical protein
MITLMLLVCGIIFEENVERYTCFEENTLSVRLQIIYTLKDFEYTKEKRNQKGCKVTLDNKSIYYVKQTCSYISKQIKGK